MICSVDSYHDVYQTLTCLAFYLSNCDHRFMVKQSLCLLTTNLTGLMSIKEMKMQEDSLHGQVKYSCLVFSFGSFTFI